MIILNKEDAFTIVDIISKAQEIVRCKDCKYWEQSFGYNCKEYWDCKLGLKDTDADDFCSRGEKR